jgi:hypothetical protein
LPLNFGNHEAVSGATRRNKLSCCSLLVGRCIGKVKRLKYIY